MIMTRRPSWNLIVAGALAALLACGNKDSNPTTDKNPDPGAATASNPGSSPSTGSPDTTAKPVEAPEPPPAALPTELPEDTGKHDGAGSWSQRLGGLGKDTARDIAIDDAGNVVVTGYHSDGADLGDGNPVAAKKVDAYVTKYGPKGEHLWTAHFGGEGEDLGNTVTFDPQGNVIVAGLFSDAITIGDTTLTSFGSDDAFIAKFDPDGKALWARKLGGTDSDGAHEVAASSRAIVVTGSFKGTLTAADITLKSEGNEDIFVLALTPEGDMSWVRQFGFRYKDHGQQVALDGRGDIILLAEFSSQITFGGETLESAGNRDLALVKLDRVGTPIWSKRFGSPFDELGLGLAVDPVGDIVITGSFDNEIDFGGDKLASEGESDVFVAKFTRDGAHRWSKSYGAARVDLGTSVAVDRFGNVLVGGWFWQSVDFGGGALTAPNGNKDAFLIKLSAKGSHLWSKHLGDRDHDQIRGLAVNKNGLIAACGLFRFTLAASAKSLESARKPDDLAPPPDAFVAVFGP